MTRFAHLLDQLTPEVKAKDFHAMCARLGNFAKTVTPMLQQLNRQPALLHEPHESGLTLIYLATKKFAPRKHGTWCAITPLHESINVQSWTEYIPPTNATGSSVAQSFPDVHYRCHLGEGVLVPEGQLFSIDGDHDIEVLLLFGSHPNKTWPESRLFIGTQHAERTLMYPNEPVAMT